MVLDILGIQPRLSQQDAHTNEVPLNKAFFVAPSSPAFKPDSAQETTSNQTNAAQPLPRGQPTHWQHPECRLTDAVLPPRDGTKIDLGLRLGRFSTEIDIVDPDPVIRVFEIFLNMIETD